MIIGLLAVADSPEIRWGVCAALVLLGGLFILAGWNNIKTREAETSGRRRIINDMVGASNTYQGGKAVAMGVVRIIAGIILVIFGFVFVAVGPFLAN